MKTLHQEFEDFANKLYSLQMALLNVKIQQIAERIYKDDDKSTKGTMMMDLILGIAFYAIYKVRALQFSSVACD